MRRKLLVLALGLPAVAPTFATEEPVERLIVIKDGRFEPAIVEVPAGRKIRLVLRNEGPGPEEFESGSLRKEMVLAEGVTRKLVIAPQKPGEHGFVGEFHEDTARGKLVVK